MKIKIFKAFTLIELLIVIIIIGILATALIPRFTGAQNKARYARVEKDIRDLKTAVFMAQTNTKKTLKDITMETCTDCPCRDLGVPLKTLALGHQCRVAWKNALRNIETAAGMDTGSLSSLETDPRGNPYLLDENEGEGSFSCTNRDSVRMFGPDGLQTDDDKNYTIPPMGCPGAY